MGHRAASAAPRAAASGTVVRFILTLFNVLRVLPAADPSRSFRQAFKAPYNRVHLIRGHGTMGLTGVSTVNGSCDAPQVYCETKSVPSSCVLYALWLWNTVPYSKSGRPVAIRTCRFPRTIYPRTPTSPRICRLTGLVLSPQEPPAFSSRLSSGRYVEPSPPQASAVGFRTRRGSPRN